MATATDILNGIARKYKKSALVREVVVEDIEHRKAQQSWYAQQFPGMAEKHFPLALPFTEEHSTVLDTHKPFRRIDGLLLDGGGLRTAIEVKISRADFMRETESKRRVWQNITDRFVYATPPGLLKASEIPADCGLWEVEGDSVAVVKRAKRNPAPNPIPHQVLVAFAYRLAKGKSRG